METPREIYIKCRFLDENKQPKGREYTYKTLIPVETGKHVYAMTAKGEAELVVTGEDVPAEEVTIYLDKIKPVYFNPRSAAIQREQ